jgi:DNA recombination protein RmuC
MEYIVFILIGLLVGMAIGYLLLKVRSGSNLVLRSEYDRIQQDLVREQEQNKYSKDQTALANQQLESLRTAHEAVQKEISAVLERVKLLDKQLLDKDQLISSLQVEKERVQNNNLLLEKANTELKAHNDMLTEKLSTFREELSKEFEVLSRRFLDEKSQKFEEFNKIQMAQVLTPFEKEIKEFKEKVDQVYMTESKERHALQGEIKKLMDLNQQLSEDAKNLTKALTADTKTQGDWGEMILEKILEQSGLVKGREFTVQESMTDHEGNRLRTDVIIKLPDERNIIIDSKVSLTDYDRFMKSEDKEEQERYLAAHGRSVKNHIDILNKKSYTDYGGSPEFIFMFIPIEPAFMVAMHSDQDLWNYGYSKGIIIIGPTNLIAALKLVSEIWKKEKQSRNAIEIAEKAGALYDKFAGFTDSLLEVGRSLEKASDHYGKAFNQLKDGKGNIMGRMEQLRKLGAKNKKQIDLQLLPEPDEEESSEEGS